MSRPILSVMPDFGGGPYLWLQSDETAGSIGMNIASHQYWAKDTHLPNVTEELREDFDDWVTQFGLYADSRGFQWESFHRRGLVLARRLKKQIGDKAIVRYLKPSEDPNHKQEAINVIE